MSVTSTLNLIEDTFQPCLISIPQSAIFQARAGCYGIIQLSDA